MIFERRRNELKEKKKNTEKNTHNFPKMIYEYLLPKVYFLILLLTCRVGR